MQDFDKLWNYNDPAATEVKFREILGSSSAAKNLSYHLQLLTQIARTYSLRAKFDEAHQTLDVVEAQLPAANDVAHIRYHLERGRSFNSAGKRAEAQKNFELARIIAKQLQQDFYVVDAIHMLAIIAPPEIAAALNEEAILFAENSVDGNAKRWLGSLYNNLAWSYFDKGELEKALSVFLRALKWFEEKQSPNEIFIAKWSVARALRALDRIDDALKVQLALFEESAKTGQKDGFVHEELGELFLLKKDKAKSAFHFEKAYQLLSEDNYLKKFEGDRLQRMQELSKGG